MHKNICNTIINEMEKEKINYLKLRDKLYDIFIYQLDTYECIWYILNELIEKRKIEEDKISMIYIKLYNFSKYYNNNYRPIYHLEIFIMYLINNLV